ncbi:MAG: hypothetical protein JKY15_02030 [Deltaproteobacteria bacterium]|nr:hypothetical protein [Deltaproteobacteria bacterium]
MPSVQPLGIGDLPYDQFQNIDTEIIKDALAITKGKIYTPDAQGRLIAPITTTSVADLSRGIMQAISDAPAPIAEDTDKVQVAKVGSRIILKADASLTVGQAVDLKAVTATTTADKVMAGVSPNGKGHLGRIFEIYSEGTDQAEKKVTADGDLVVIDVGVA